MTIIKKEFTKLPSRENLARGFAPWTMSGNEETKMLEFTFGYEVDTTNLDEIAIDVEFKHELTEDQAARLKASFQTGKYYWLDEDESIADIYDEIYDIAIESEEQSEYGDRVGMDVTVGYFRYPKELKES